MSLGFKRSPKVPSLLNDSARLRRKKKTGAKKKTLYCRWWERTNQCKLSPKSIKSLNGQFVFQIQLWNHAKNQPLVYSRNQFVKAIGKLSQRFRWPISPLLLQVRRAVQLQNENPKSNQAYQCTSRFTQHNLIIDLVRYLVDFSRDYYQQTFFWYMKSHCKVEKIEEEESRDLE